MFYIVCSCSVDCFTRLNIASRCIVDIFTIFHNGCVYFGSRSSAHSFMPLRLALRISCYHTDAVTANKKQT